MSRKRNTFMSGPNSTYYPQAPDIEAAKHLREMAAAYVKNTVTFSDVLIAWVEFQTAVQSSRRGGA